MNERPLSMTAAIAIGLSACGGNGNPAGNDDAAIELSDNPAQIGCRTQALTLGRPAPRIWLTQAKLTALSQRAVDGEPAWQALKQRCDALVTGTMYPPSGPAYPDRPDVGMGYQGDEYVEPTLALGLCYRTAAEIDSDAAADYGDAGERLLHAIATPESESGFPVATNSGYGIRHFGLALAIGYDWLYPALSADVRQRVIDSLNHWIDWYDTEGFLNDDPIANYFVGYFEAKTMAALATEGDNPRATEQWNQAQTLFEERALPAYSKYLAGGGWPEGWGYAPRAVRGIVEVLAAVQTAKGIDWSSQLPFAEDTSRYLVQFAWPSLNRMDDYGTIRSGVSIQPSLGLMGSLRDTLADRGNPYAAILQGFADDVMSAGGDTRAEWETFLLWDPEGTSETRADEPLYYLARGPSHAAARSSWDRDAVWWSLTGGSYINALDSGEQLFDAGSIGLVRGGDPVLVRPTGWIPYTSGSRGANLVYEDSFGSGGRRLYNTFFVDDPNFTKSPGQNMNTPEVSEAKVDVMEDSGVYTRVRATHLEDQYGAPGAQSPVTEFTRDVVYMRPGALVIRDRTDLATPSHDHWFAFHTPVEPEASDLGGEVQRFDVNSGSTAGSVQVVFPAQASVTKVPVLDDVWRLEVRDPEAKAQQQWMTLITAGDQVPRVVALGAEQGNVQEGDLLGVHLQADRDEVVLFANASEVGDSFAYSLTRDGAADHVLVGVAPNPEGYSVSVSDDADESQVLITPGGPLMTTESGTLSFEVSDDGEVVESEAAASPPEPTEAPDADSDSEPKPTDAPRVTSTSATEPEAPAMEPEAGAESNAGASSCP